MSRAGRTMGTMDPAFLGTRPVPADPNVRSVRQQAQSDLVVVPDVGRWLNARHDITTEDGQRTVQTAEATRKLALGLTLTSALGALCADNECAHGGLPADPVPQPGCTPECRGYPRELPTIEPEEEMRVTAITETHHGSRDVADPEAPYGRKEDGTPRKKPAPSPEHIEAIRAGHRARAAARAAEREVAVAVETPPAPAEAPEAEVEADPPAPPAPTLTPSPLVARWLVELDERVHTLQDEIGERERELAELLEARERLLA